MKIFRIAILTMLVAILFGCSDPSYTKISDEQSFVAAVSTIDPAITFINEEKEVITTWRINEPITGAALIGEDAIALYGHQLDEIKLYELSTGKIKKIIQAETGTTNVYYVKNYDQFFVTNGKTNELEAYSGDGKKLYELKLKNYPMSMIAYEQFLYVINYKDEFLHVINLDKQAIENTWPIEMSSHGMLVNGSKSELWIGGHGAGQQSNQSVKVFDIQTGQLLRELSFPIMPVGMTQLKDQFAITSHGDNHFYITDELGNVIQKEQIAANPFAVTTYSNQFVLAGYDDQTIYFIDEKGGITETLKVSKGPFQLLVREETK